MSTNPEQTNHSELQPPTHPLPAGGKMPELNLAGSDGFNVASGKSIQSMPDPGKPEPSMPTLHGSPEMGGIDPQTPVPSLNLAGVEGVPPPAELLRPAQTTIHQPDYGMPGTSVPALQSNDLATAGITYVPGSQYAPDPAMPDLTEYRHPYGLDIQSNDIWAVDPSVADLLHYDVPGGITVRRHPQEADPLLPDLQHPDLTPDVQMSTRPGDLDPSALRQMHLSPDFARLGGESYPEVQFDQSGMNTTRRRHLDLLMGGLDTEERR
ncbi:MAG TPA: hypothetical protein VKR06_20930 [Ktedonosporobacter sp.]|nr:hypothetical protein [Ktedonosporobacter sp.]